MSDLISIIMPVYNAETYVAEAINSVVGQSWENWELLIINDGSTDNTESVIKSFKDKRIRYFKQLNKGASAARNVGLANMEGKFFCFLDADDNLPRVSLETRLNIFNDSSSNLMFVDGVVEKRDETLKHKIDIYTPTSLGNPVKDLVRLNGKCFFGLSWMIKRIPGESYGFNEKLTHCEDLLFYLELGIKGGEYAFSKEPVYIYRNTPLSAMKLLDGLNSGYHFVYLTIKEWPTLKRIDKLIFKYRMKRIMFLSYLMHQGNVIRAFQVLFK